MQKTIVRNASVSIMLLVAIFMIMAISLFHGAMSRAAAVGTADGDIRNAAVMTVDTVSGGSYAG